MDRVEVDVNNLKSIITKQNQIIKQLTEELMKLTKISADLKQKLDLFYTFQPKKVVLHSLINQSINQSNTSSSTKKNFEDTSLKTNEFSSSIGNNGVKHTPSTSLNTPRNLDKNDDISVNSQEFDDSIRNQGQMPDQASIEYSKEITKEKVNLDFLNEIKPKNILDENFQIFKSKLNETFKNLSKQELKVFLTIYQLSDENKALSYSKLADILKLSENGVRSYVSILIKKGLPITKHKINNKIAYLTIQKDFKNLNLRHKLISLYYGTDPFQTTLFDAETP